MDAPDNTTTKRTFRQRAKRFAPALVLALAVAILLYFSFGTRQRRGPETGSQQAAQEHKHEKDVYYCPMHTSYRSDKPGDCPICNMKLVKMENGPAKPPEGANGSAMQGMPGMAGSSDIPAEGAAPAAPTGNAIFIPPQKQQLIGMRSVEASVEALTKEIRTVGKVAYDETRVTHIHTKVSGYIEEVFADFVGKPVKKGQPLFTIYSPELVATQQEYLLALKSQGVLKDSEFSWVSSGSNNLVEASRERLRLWDVTDEDIRQLAREGKIKRAIPVYSPVSGIVTERAAYHHGTFVNPEMDLYTIVDLSRVWVLGDVFEYELPYVKLGQMAEVEFPYSVTAKTLRGRVSFVSPFVDPKTRTAQVRIEFANLGMTLRPDQFVNMRLNVNLGDQLVVPMDAVLNTGTEQYVFIDKGNGYVEPRRVTLGAEAGGNYGIREGLKAKERVVTAANFIVDSESRLKGAFANMGGPSTGAMPASAGNAPQSLQINIQEPKTAKVGSNAMRLSIRDASGKPIEGAEVEVSLFMPQMGSMAPMSSKGQLKSVGGGEYTGTIDVPMAWTWQTTVTVKQNGRVLGSTQTNLTAR